MRILSVSFLALAIATTASASEQRFNPGDKTKSRDDSIAGAGLEIDSVDLNSKKENRNFNPGDKTKSRDDSTAAKGINVLGASKQAASAPQELELKISGGTSFNAYIFKNKLRQSTSVQGAPIDPNYGKGQGTYFGVDDSRLNFEVAGSWYSFLIGITGNTESGKTSVEENRLKFKGPFGTLLLGAARGVTDFMAVGAYNFIGGTGGIFGNYKSVAYQTTGAVIRDDLVGVAKDQNKATYVTPRYAGFQAGYSYTPNGRQAGEASLSSLAPASSKNQVSVTGQNIHEVGVNYKASYENGLSFKTAVTAVFAQAQSSRDVLNKYDNAASYAIGAVLGYQGFHFGGEYLDNGNSYRPRIDSNGNAVTGNDAGKGISIGAGYSWHVHALSLAYFTTKKKLGQSNGVSYGDIKSDVMSLTYDIKVAQGFKVYAEGVHYKYKPSNVDGHARWVKDTMPGYYAGGNTGHSIVFGSAISF